MSAFLTFIVTSSLSLMALGCADTPSPQKSPDRTGTAQEATALQVPTRVEGWWELGDSCGPFTATLRGDDIVTVERDLWHGEYGTTRDRFEFESGRLARYSQDSKLRLMDPDDRTRLVPVSMRIALGSSGELTAGEKTIDGVTRAIEPADIDRVLAQVETLLERVRAFAEFHATGGERVRFVCPDDRAFTVTFAAEVALLDLGPAEGQHIVRRQSAASGAKYGSESFLVWTKGDEVIVELHGQSYLSGCRAVN